MNKITTSDWYAWINKQPIQPTTEGTLHVVDSVISHRSKEAVLRKKTPQGINPKILLLEIVLHESGVPTKQPQTVRYAESLNSASQYSSIEIHFSSSKETEIDQIPIIE